MRSFSIIPVIIILLASAVAIFLMIYRRLSRIATTVKEDRRYLFVLLNWRSQLIDRLKQTSQDTIDLQQNIFMQTDTLYHKTQLARKNKQFSDYMENENKISEIVPSIIEFVEQNIKLRENAEALELKNNLSNLQNELVSVQKIYNKDLDVYNAGKSSLLDSLMTKLFAKQLQANFPYWKIDTTTVFPKKGK